MARQLPYRRKPPAQVGEMLEEGQNFRFYVVREAGPTSFVLRAENSNTKYKIQIGNRHTCSCSTTPELCPHIIFVLLKRYRIPTNNPLIWQLSWTDDEINQVLTGRVHHVREAPKVEKKGNVQIVKRRPVDDVCPICYEDMSAEEYLVFCKHGCGNNIHGECMRVWANHHADNLTCPMCRAKWGKFSMKVAQKRDQPAPGSGSSNEPQYRNVKCEGCHGSPLRGNRYRCTVCPNFNLCSGCFHDTLTHSQHSFTCQKREGDACTPVPQTSRLSGTGLMGTAIIGLTTHTHAAHSSSSQPPNVNSQNRNEQQQQQRTRINVSSNNHNNSEPTTSHNAVQASSSSSVPTQPQNNGLTQMNPDVAELMFRDISPEDYDTLLRLDNQVKPTHILTEAQTQAIPTLTVQHHNEAAHLLENESSCAICLTEFEVEDQVKLLPICGHAFHADCITQWLTENRGTCPVDNQPVIVHVHAAATSTVVEPTSNSSPTTTTSQSYGSLERESESGDGHESVTQEEIDNNIYQEALVQSATTVTTTATEITVNNNGSTGGLVRTLSLSGSNARPNQPHHHRQRTSQSSNGTNKPKRPLQHPTTTNRTHIQGAEYTPSHHDLASLVVGPQTGSQLMSEVPRTAAHVNNVRQLSNRTGSLHRKHSTPQNPPVIPLTGSSSAPNLSIGTSSTMPIREGRGPSNVPKNGVPRAMGTKQKSGDHNRTPILGIGGVGEAEKHRTRKPHHPPRMNKLPTPTVAQAGFIEITGNLHI